MCLKKIKTLEEVSMPQNGICYEGIAALARAFWHNPHLRVIDLNDNTLTSRGAAAISSVSLAVELACFDSKNSLRHSYVFRWRILHF